MKGFIAAAALFGAALATPFPQAAPAGCSSSRDGTFTIAAVNITKRDLDTRQTNAQLTLKNGVLTDAQGRTGCIVANRQFQFDNPIQSGAVYTSGWSVCANGSLAVAGNAVFYQCLSGNFYNLYDRSQGGQCNAVYIVASGASSAPGAPVSQVSDGQPQASTKASQISDGQVQAPTGSAKVTQISDGQIQAPTSTAKPITQISDGQIQAPTSTAKPITQISDGQIQAPTSTAKPITQISDGQIQAPTSTARPITQISDGQIQAPTSTRPAVATFTGAAARVGGSFAFVAGIVGAVAML